MSRLASPAELQAQLDTAHAETQQWAERAARLLDENRRLQADLRMWRLRYRLRHWTIQMPPEAVHMPIPEQRRSPALEQQVRPTPTPAQGIPMGVRVPGRRPGL